VSKEHSRSRVARAKAAVEVLTSREREQIVEYIRKASAKAGRARVVADMKEALHEIENGGGIRGSAEDIMKALLE
jgi:hypothetical protein